MYKYEKVASSDLARYETWKSSYNCNLNCTGSSPGMETAGATKIFSSSKEKHELYYTSFYRDGNARQGIFCCQKHMVQLNLLRSLSVTIKNMTIAIIAQNLNLHIHRISIKKINKTTPARSYMCHFLILS